MPLHCHSRVRRHSTRLQCQVHSHGWEAEFSKRVWLCRMQHKASPLPPSSPVWLPQFNHEGGIFTRAGAFKIHNERNDKLCLEKEALLEGVGGAQLPENRYLWFEPPRPWPLVAHRAAAPGAPAGPSVHMKVLS